MYGSVLSLLSEGIILLIRLRDPALELCRLANIGDSGKASLETVCILTLPVLTSRACLQWANCHCHGSESKNHLGHAPSSTEGSVDARCRRLRFVFSDAIVNVGMRFKTLSGYDLMVELFVRRRTLLEFTNPEARVGATGVAGMGVGTVLMLPWETWGPANSRILDLDMHMQGWLSGERRATVLMRDITMRDYNPYRVRRALALLGVAGRETTLACGSVVKVVKEASVYRGGEIFCNDVETSLPYVETVTSYDGCYDISMDENYLVAEVLTEVSHVHLRSSIKALRRVNFFQADERKLYLHSL